MTSVDARQASVQVEFKAFARPIWVGMVGGAGLVASLLGLAAATGRLVNVDATFVVTIVSCLVGSGIYTAWSGLSNARRAAASLGRIEVDSRGIRWQRGDGVVAFHARWEVLEGATVERRKGRILLQRRGDAPFLISSGSGFVALERFDELERSIASRIPTNLHETSPPHAIVSRNLAWGMAVMFAGVALYGVNRGLAVQLNWIRASIVMPFVVAAVGLVIIVSSLRAWLGRAPMVSPAYGSGYPRAILRFLLVASIVNVILVAVINGLVP